MKNDEATEKEIEAAKERWRAEQLKMKEKLVEMDRFVWQIDDYLASSSTTTTLSRKKIQRLAGVDISFLKGSNKHACASLVVLELSSFRVLYEALKYFSLPAPYITGFLAFREVPALQELYQDLLDRYPDLEPDVTLVDGNGILHPEGFGLASHFGVLMDIPTVGVSKTFLHVDGLSKTDIKEIVASEAKESELHNGVSLIGKSGRCWGVALTGGKGVKNPIYVSVGHCISLKSAVKIVQACCLYRIPEPIRQADLRSREIIRRWEAEGKVDTLLDKCKIQSS